MELLIHHQPLIALLFQRNTTNHFLLLFIKIGFHK